MDRLEVFRDYSPGKFDVNELVRRECRDGGVITSHGDRSGWMNTGKIDVTGLDDDGVTWTSLATLYLRAWESRAERSILGDHYAAARHRANPGRAVPTTLKTS